MYQPTAPIKIGAMQSINLTDHFLIAMPAMADPYFAKGLVYIAEHNDQGALGVIGRASCRERVSTIV